MDKSKSTDILLLSTADWDNPFWTNKQHVAVALSKMGKKVLYVESLGLRSPSFNKADISRILRRLVRGIRFPRQVSRGIWVCSPLVLPFQKYLIVRIFNKAMLNIFLTLYMRILGFKNVLIWTYNPMSMEFLSIRQDDYLVYHCVDEVKVQPGMPVAELDLAERQLVKRANCIFATSAKLYGSRKLLNPETYFFSNVADYWHFSKAMDEGLKKPVDISNLNGPIVGFVGAISSYKVDFKLIEFIARQRPEWSIVLIGKVGEGEPGTNVSDLKKCSNVYLLGPKSYEMLPAYIRYFDVGIIPSPQNEYTHSMFPMKFFEYLAAGKQVVATDIDSLRQFSGYFFSAKTYDDFVQGIESMLKNAPGNIQERLEFARSMTYESRMEKMMNVINSQDIT